MISNGKTVRIAYNLTIDGRLVECVDPAKPMRFVQGSRQIARGLQAALKGLKVGERKSFTLKAKDGFGKEKPEAILECRKDRFVKRDHYIGRQIKSPRDGKYLATVKAVNDKTLLLNFNHPYAGKALHYDVFVVSIEGEGHVALKKKKR